MKYPKITLLKVDELENSRIIKLTSLCNTFPFSTDYAKMLSYDYIENPKCTYWLEEFDEKMQGSVAEATTENIKIGFREVCNRRIGIRPVMRDFDIADLDKKNFEEYSENGRMYYTFEYGEYPQSIVNSMDYINDLLEEGYANHTLEPTKKTYTVDGTYIKKENYKMTPLIFEEYRLKDNGNKYVRGTFKSYKSGKHFVKYATPEYKKGKRDDEVFARWFKVEPINWIYDPTLGVAISENVLLSGISIDPNTHCDNRNTQMHEYLSTVFKLEMLDEKTLSEVLNRKNTNLPKNESKTRKQNPYNFDFSEVTEEEIIKGAIQSNVSVFLHGRSSEGKSARVKQLDPDCEIIYMRNATPDSLNGKSVYNQNTGEMIDIPPTWYTKIKEKCEKEPNKIHLVFFDELTNALPSIQGMAFNIILDGEINGKWKLPKNARIVAAGNDLTDSLAANQMAEPLFNRFAHVYINTEVEDWLNWAVTPEEEYQRIDYIEKEKTPKIHPAIYSYISYKSFSGKDILRTPYNGETPNADPRKWEMASKVLTETNRPEMLRALIGSDLTRDFIAFSKKEVITLEDVLNNNYSEEDLNMNLAEKFSTVANLSRVDETHFEQVREFVKKLGSEVRASFESMWAHGDKKRLEKIAELHVKDMEQIKESEFMQQKIKLKV